ncbi:hypothetical protein KUTeg_024137 [Tegillarca granosa]|uniref:TTF-type domain-containing protein n=1 Tax=Tegillarca granosa TaxID=220873 RepID=A0ABQ9DWG6_TEGGR|nr:hypothetical protein KUTeg_024137 [Tegillarca granosa]
MRDEKLRLRWHMLLMRRTTVELKRSDLAWQVSNDSSCCSLCRVEYGIRRQFSSEWLEKYCWLRYSVSEDSVYCAPCVLFSPHNAKEKSLVTTPVTKWSNLGKYIKRHLSLCAGHHGACASAESFMKIHCGEKLSVQAQLDSKHAADVRRNRHVLGVITEVIVLCGRQNIPLRSHDDKSSNFMALLNDRAKRDSILKEHLESSYRSKYTSPMIQNELICICEEYIRNEIVKDCNESVCYSFMADEATDASTMEQIAMCVRWASRANLLYTFKAAFTTIVNALEVFEHEGDAKTRSYRCSILKFDFIISLVAVEFIIQGLLPLNNMLQGKCCDLIEAAKEARVLIAQIRAERADDLVWEALYEKAVTMATVHDVLPSKPRTTGRQQQRVNVPAESVSDYWKRALFFPFMDHLATELEDRLLTAHDRFLAQYLIPSQLHQLTTTHVDGIYAAYSYDFIGDKEAFQSEVSRWKIRWSLDDGSESEKPVDLKSTVDSTNKDLYPNIFTCLVILLTMPVSTASAERAFRVMRRVKTYFRSTMTSQRMSGLAMLHSYKNVHIDIDKIINEFVGKSNRKLGFL